MVSPKQQNRQLEQKLGVWAPERGQIRTACLQHRTLHGVACDARDPEVQQARSNFQIRDTDTIIWARAIGSLWGKFRATLGTRGMELAIAAPHEVKLKTVLNLPNDAGGQCPVG